MYSSILMGGGIGGRAAARQVRGGRSASAQEKLCGPRAVGIGVGRLKPGDLGQWAPKSSRPIVQWGLVGHSLGALPSPLGRKAASGRPEGLVSDTVYQPHDYLIEVDSPQDAEDRIIASQWAGDFNDIARVEVLRQCACGTAHGKDVRRLRRRTLAQRINKTPRPLPRGFKFLARLSPRSKTLEIRHSHHATQMLFVKHPTQPQPGGGLPPTTHLMERRARRTVWCPSRNANAQSTSGRVR
jgi:hypothetical protein